GQFNVGTGERATFTGPTAITNIMSRVTGGQPSRIDGQIRSEIAGAHLFLLNPSGGSVWSQCKPGRQWVVSCQHGGLPAPRGWSDLFGASGGLHRAECGPARGLWLFGAHLSG